MGLLFLQPKKLTASALGVLSRNASDVLCFTDGSATENGGGVGAIMRFGQYIVEVARPISKQVTSDMAELLAIETVLDLFPYERKLIIKSDCKAVVNMLVNNHVSKSKTFSLVLSRVKSKLSKHNVELSFISKTDRVGTAHSKADRLATRARIRGEKIFRIHTPLGANQG